MASGRAKGIASKEALDTKFYRDPLAAFKKYRLKTFSTLGVKPGHAWRTRDLRDRGKVNFGGYKTLERAWEVGERMVEAFAEGKSDRHSNAAYPSVAPRLSLKNA